MLSDRPDFHVFCPQLPDEPGDCYEALYEWSLLRSRTFTGLINALRERWGDRGEVPGPFLIREWQQSYAWEARVAEYDREARLVKEAWRSQQFEMEAGEGDRIKLRLAMGMLAKAEQILKLPIVEQRVERDGKTTVIKPLRTSVRDVTQLSLAAAQILEQSRPRSMAQELLEGLGVYLKGLESDVLSAEQCEAIARHLAAMKAELEGGTGGTVV